MDMNGLIEAIFEAERFLGKARKAKNKYLDEKWNSFYCCKEAAAVKRASMDLSRALSKIRRS